MVTSTAPLGAWENDREVIETTPLHDRGDISDLDQTIQFQVYVARLVRRREENLNAEFDSLAAFVLVSSEEFEALKTGRLVERLIHTGARRLTRRVHFVTAAATSSVIEELPQDDETSPFSQLENLGVKNHPTLIYVPQKPSSSLSYYPYGSCSDSGVTEVAINAPAVTVEKIEHAIHRVHAEELVTPDNSGPLKIWHDANGGKPTELAERSIQQLIRAGLVVGFAPYSIRQEQAGKLGRTDLEIVDDRNGQAGANIHHALLELKVLRSRGMTGISVSATETSNHISEGVDQAYSYGKDKNSRLTMLCCFDMRDSDIPDVATFEHVAAKSISLKVLLRRWYLYRTSQLYRAAVAMKATKT